MSERDTACTEALGSAAIAFRLGMEGQASKEFVRFVDSLLQRLQSFPRPNLNELSTFLNELFAAQSRKDYLYIADLLEIEISPRLKRVSSFE
jgi:hypothetical protein